MARVHIERNAPAPSGATRHKHVERRKAPYRVVIEEVTRKKRLNTFLSLQKNPPIGYTFIPAGDPQLTKRCKKFSKELGMTVYIVSASDRQAIELTKEVSRIGYHFSTFVVDRACQSLGVTLNSSGRVAQSHFAILKDDELNDLKMKRTAKPKRSNAKIQRQLAAVDTSLSQALIDSQAREAIQDLFPKIPQRDLHEVVVRAFDKNQDLVGTAEGTSLVRRANLAVVAHIRHMYTNYDELLKSGMPWRDARRGVEKFTLDKLVSWRGEDEDDDDSIMEDVLREVVVISDDEGESDDVNSPNMHMQSLRGAVVRAPPLETVTEAARGAFVTDVIDLTMLDDHDDEDNSDEEGSEPYVNHTHVHQPYIVGHNRMREERMGHERHARWEQAVNRHRHDPVAANYGQINRAELKIDDETDMRPASSFHKTQKIASLETYNVLAGREPPYYGSSRKQGGGTILPSIEVDQVKQPQSNSEQALDQTVNTGRPPGTSGTRFGQIPLSTGRTERYIAAAEQRDTYAVSGERPRSHVVRITSHPPFPCESQVVPCPEHPSGSTQPPPLSGHVYRQIILPPKPEQGIEPRPPRLVRLGQQETTKGATPQHRHVIRAPGSVGIAPGHQIELAPTNSFGQSQQQIITRTSAQGLQARQ